MASLEERFFSKIDKQPSGCWHWTASKKDGRRGQLMLNVDGKKAPVGAHRVAWMLAHGSLPDATLVCTCDNILCVNHEHFVLSEYDTLTPSELFRCKIHCTSTGCHEWQGRRSSGGYGLLMYTWPDGTRKDSFAHRVAWHLAFGIEPPQNMLHKCDNPPCCNVDHLFSGSQKDNVDDMVSKGRDAFRRENWSSWTRGEKHPKAKLSNDLARQVRADHAAGATQRSLAKKYNVSTQCIYRIVNNKGYKEAGGVQSQV